MTARQLYEGVLIELNKENAPNILLEDFNYFANKAINNYINKRYNIYDVNQQTTDDLRVLKATALLSPSQVTDYQGLTMAGDKHMATYEVVMPSDYLHILNCICIYKVKKTYKCYNAGDTWRAAATRLTADMYSQVLDNFWNKPTYKRPYYYIHNVNTSNFIPTNPYGNNGKTFKLLEKITDGSWYNDATSSTGTGDGSNYSGGGTGQGNSGNGSSGTYNIPINFESDGIEGTFIELDLGQYPHKLYFYYNNTYYSLNVNNGNKLAIDLNGNLVESTFLLEFLNNVLSATVYMLNGSYIINFPDNTSNGSGSSGGSTGGSANGSGGSISINAGASINTTTYSLAILNLGTDADTLSYSSEQSFDKDRSESFSCHFKYSNNNTGASYSYGNDAFGNKIVQGKGLPRVINILLNGTPEEVSNIERGLALRYGNVSLVRLEIRYGTDNQVFELKLVYIDYIKAPLNIRLTQQELDLTEDTSQMLEYPDYVCQEIINELVHLVMENISDLRLQTHPVVTLSIANPAQALAPQAQGLSAQ